MTRRPATPHRNPTGHGQIGPHGVETEPLEPHRGGPGRIVPRDLARDIPGMGLQQLEFVAGMVLGRLGLVAEAPGTKINADSLAHQKPGAQPPSSSPLCTCACPSRRDHHERAINRAVQRGAESDPFDLTALRSAVLRAAFDLDTATRRPDRPTDPREAEEPHERDERCLATYEGMPADVAADLESHWSGQYVSPEAMRRMRRRNSVSIDLGRPLPAPEELRRDVLALSWEGKSASAIAREIGIGRSSVGRILADQQLGQEANA